ncbi:MAG: hypothetical protein CM1200mP3_05300 [Chloroflexota bacterium]|nr:MAG: hypothetical protein CM1200mP3_05300 [Chloroflexota bacterium]
MALIFVRGRVLEMLEDPGTEIYDVIRYFGNKGKIFNVHFRNITGGFLDFVETYIDDGDVDMRKCVEGYKKFDYQFMLMPDQCLICRGKILLWLDLHIPRVYQRANRQLLMRCLKRKAKISYGSMERLGATPNPGLSVGSM